MAVYTVFSSSASSSSLFSSGFIIVLSTLCTLLVAQLVEALRSKPEGRGFDSRWCHWNFSLM
jgi:hypothetical protein